MKAYFVKIYLFALVLRLLPVILAGDLGIGLDDMFQYDMLARSLTAGNGYRWYSEADLDLVSRYVPTDFIVEDYDPQGIVTSFRPPGYPFFLTLIYTIFGLEQRFFWTRVIQAFIGAAVPILTYLLAQKLFPENEKISRYAALVVLFYPMLIIYPLALVTENTFIPLMLGAFLITLSAAESEKPKDYILAGLLFGLASLTRSVISLAVLFIVIWLYFNTKDKRSVILLPLCMLVLTLPWATRNTLLNDRLTYIESSLGYDLHMGYHPESTGTFKYGVSLELFPYLDDSVRDELGMERALGFIREDLGRVPQLILYKLGHFFGLEKRAISYFYANNFFGHISLIPLAIIFLIFVIPFMLVATIAALGIPWIKWTRKRILLIILLVGYIFPHLVILAEPRFHLSILPLLAIFFGYCITIWSVIWHSLKIGSSRPAFALTLVLVALLWINWGYEINRDSTQLINLLGPNGNQLYSNY